MRMALSIDLGCWAVDPEIEAAVRDTAASLRDAGAIVEEVEVPVYIAMGQNPTCVGTTPQANGQIKLLNFHQTNDKK